MSEKTLPIVLRASSELAGAQTEYGGTTEDAVSEGTTDATTGNKLDHSEATFVADGVAVNDIVHNTTDDTWALVTAIDSETVLTVSPDIMETAEDYEIISGKGYKFQRVFRELQVLLDVTVDVTASGDKLDVYIDTSLDGGITWLNIGHFTQHDGDAGAKKYVMSLRADNPGASAVWDVTSDTAETTTRQAGFNDRIRYRAKTTQAGTAAFTFSIKAFLK